MPDQPSDFLGIRGLVAGLRDGKAGFVPRVALSFTGGVASIAALMFVLGVIESSGGRVREESVFLGLFVALAVWSGVLILIWKTYPRWRHALTTILTCVIVLVSTVAIDGVLGSVFFRPEFLIVSTSLLGVGATIAVIASAIHRASRGRAIVGPQGQVDVRCPRCQYSLSGLDSTACPECGHRCTIDALILAQGYEGAKRVEEKMELPRLPAAEAV